MARFRYIALDGSGKETRGVLDADSPGALADQLHARHHLLVRADELGKEGTLARLLSSDIALQRGVPKATLALFTRELSVMLEAGQDVDRALKFLAETTDDKRLARVVAAARDKVRGGKALAAALADHPEIFSKLYISLVRAGEAGGNLAESLAHLATLLERESRLAATVQSALIYPALLAAASIGTVVLLLTYVLPQFTPIFEQAGARLPLGTRIMIGAGDALRDNGLLILIALLIAGLLVHRALAESAIRLKAEAALLRVPLVGTLIRRVQAARFTRTVGTLTRNGVGLVAALTIGRDVLSSRIAARHVDTAIAEVKSGSRLAAVLAAGGFFPSQTVHLVQLGEETGKLGDMALRAADIHDDQVQQTIQRLVSLLVPVVTIAMGLIVAGIVGSLLAAMLSLNDIVG